MEKARKWKRVIAIMLTVAMIFQNGASVTAAGDLNGVPETTAESNAQAESEAAAKAESEAAAKAESEAAAKAESEAAAKAESEAAAKAESEAAGCCRIKLSI